MPLTYRIRPTQHGGPSRVIALSEPDEDGQIPNAWVTVKPAEEVPNFDDRPTTVRSGGTTKTVRRLMPSDERDELFGYGAPMPTQLFTHLSPQITHAFADPSLRHTFPTMVGMAMNDLNAQGDIPMADSDLSSFSSPLSQKAASRGLATGHPLNPGMESSDAGSVSQRRTMFPQRNSPEYVERHHGSNTAYRAATSDEVSGGRNWVRNRLRTEKTSAATKATEAARAAQDEGSISKQEWQDSTVSPGPGQLRLF